MKTTWLVGSKSAFTWFIWDVWSSQVVLGAYLLDIDWLVMGSMKLFNNRSFDPQGIEFKAPKGLEVNP